MLVGNSHTKSDILHQGVHLFLASLVPLCYIYVALDCGGVDVPWVEI